MKYFAYQDQTRQWRWRLRSSNNKIIANSGEGYHNKAECLAAIELVKGSKDAPVRDE